jgi:hypothetical protein
VASEEKSSSGISIQTLAISAVAAVAAALIVPRIWDRGTLIATAMTPVIVSLVSEFLRRPADRITATAKTVTSRSGTGVAVRDPEFDPLPPGERDVAVREDDPFGLRSERPRIRRRHWWLALATGMAAFAVAAVFLTTSELVLGGPATREGGRTTLIRGGGDDKREATPTATPEATETAAPTQTATPEATSTPTATPSPSATASPTPVAPAAEPPAATPTATP